MSKRAIPLMVGMANHTCYNFFLFELQIWCFIQLKQVVNIYFWQCLVGLNDLITDNS